MTDQAELERRLEENEAEMASLRQEQARDRERMLVFGFLRGEWVKQIEAGTVDWDDLISRFESALAKAREARDA
jgi:hypothetical protein